MTYIIVNIHDNDLCWSNAYGWVTDDYDSFSEEEKETLNLPTDGRWESVPWFLN